MMYFTRANSTGKLVSEAGFVCFSARKKFHVVVPENILANEKSRVLLFPVVQIRYFVIE